MKTDRPNLVDSLAAMAHSKSILQRRLIETGMGVLTALREHRISYDQAWEDFFNIDNYRAVRRRRLSPLLVDFFEWGMELEDVAKTVPAGLPESYQSMSKLADKLLKRPQQGDLPRRQPAANHRIRRAG
jgi:uncharacterized protein DUF3969